MEKRYCSVFGELLTDLERNPLSSLLVAIVDGSPELHKIISEHFHGCVACQTRLDKTEHSESWTEEMVAAFSTALISGLALDAGDSAPIEDLRKEQEDEEAPVREAVQGFINTFPELGLENWGLDEEDFSLYGLYAATMGISSLLRRHAHLKLKDSKTEFLMLSSGDVLAGEEIAITKEIVFFEIARFTELWIYSDDADDLSPSSPDIRMAGNVFNWVWHALELNSNLLPRYLASTENSNGVMALKLKRKKPEERDDSLDRWKCVRPN